MAQTIKLKRSATQGKVPSTGNLALGEIAVNTYDGRLFFKKNDGSDSIEHIVTTDSVTTGSITISGTTQTTTLTTTNRIDKQYLDDEVLNTSLNTFTGSAITITGNGTSGSIAVFNDTHEVTNAAINSLDSGTTITHDNDTNIIFTVSGSNGELLTITDSNSGNLLEVNDSSGIDVFTVSATGDVSASGAITASGVTGLTTLTVDDITLNGSTISDSGDLTLDIGGDLNIDVDGTDIILKDGGTAFGRFKRDSSDFIIKSEANNEDIVLRGQDGGATIDALTLDMSEAGAASFNSTVSATGITLTSLSNQASEATALMINGSNVIGTRELGSNAFTSTTITPDGGDADTVDTLHASSFLRSDATDTATGVITFSNTTNSTSKTTGGVKISGGVGIAKTLNVGEDVVAFASSDERYKDNVTPIENPNEKLKQIGGYTFDWNDNHEVFKGQHDVGVIAQEIEKVLPEIVETRESGYKAVKYEKIVALLIESNKELLKRIEDLESKLK